MFRRYIKFVINKGAVIRVVDRLSAYGTIRVESMRDGKTYSLSMYCKAKDTQRCLDGILSLCKEGVWIRRMNLTYRI